ncbi:unnamed protein product [Bathycoccus prasinos]
MSFATTFTSSRCSLSLSGGSSMNILSSSFSSHRGERGWVSHQKNTTTTKSTHGRGKNLTAAASCASSNHRHHHPTTTRGKNYFQKKRTTLNETHATVNGLNAIRGAKNTHSRRRPRGGGSSATIVGKSFSSSQREERRTTNDEDEDEDEEMFAEETEEEENDNVLMEAPTSRRQHRASEKENQKPNNNNKMLTKMNQSDITSQLSRLDDAKSILEVVEEKSEQFSPNNSVQALHRIAVSLTTRAGRLRRKEAKFVLADARFSVLLDCVETHANKLDKLGLERRKWSYAKLALPSEYRMRAALSVRLLDRAKDLQGDLMDATDAGFILNRVEEQYDVFNKVNASTALHRLARVITQPNFGSNNNNSKKRAAKSRTVKSTMVVNTLGVSGATTTASERKEEDEEEGNNSDEEGGYRPVSTKKELLVDPRFQALLEMCETKIPEMSPLGLSNVSWALARLFSDDPTRVKSLLSAISKRSALQMKYADAKCLSTILWALAALGFEPRSRLLASAQRRACEIEEEFRAPDVANALWAYAKWARLFSGGVGALKESVDYSEDESVDEGSSKSYGGDRAVITSLLRQSEAVMETFSAYQCANICWSSATLNAKLPETYLENLLERIAKESDSLDGVALTHAAWAVGVVGSPVHGESDAFQTLISACADRAAIEKTTENKDENRRRRVSKAGCAGALWACGRICFEPSPEDCEKLMVRLFDGESNNLDAQALAYAVWGISTIEDVELDERRRERVMARLKELVEKENVGPTHAAAFRAAAVGAGLDASALAETLKVPA